MFALKRSFSFLFDLTLGFIVAQWGSFSFPLMVFSFFGIRFIFICLFSKTLGDILFGVFYLNQSKAQLIGKAFLDNFSDCLFFIRFFKKRTLSEFY